MLNEVSVEFRTDDSDFRIRANHYPLNSGWSGCEQTLGNQTRINPDLRPLGVNVVHKSFHISELLVGLNSSLLISSTLPTVVDVYINVAGVFHAVGAMASAAPRTSAAVTLQAK